MRRRAQHRLSEEESFREAFTDLYPLAHRVAWRLIGNAAAAEDVASEALARTFARWSHVSQLPYRDAWVLRVAANLAIDVVRLRRPVVDPPRPVDVEDATATKLALAAALKALPSRQRDAVVLRYLHGYSESEVAQALGVSPGTVKTHLKRGLASLRGTLGKEFERDTIAI